jgi:glycogen debranching enzyme
MLQSIQDYVTTAPDGLSLLSESVKRRFPRDDSWVSWNDPSAYTDASTVAEIIQEILQCHARGIAFREHNAGPNLDMQMSDRGFNIKIEVDWTNGLVFGGNCYNCGTWMDKMGESQKAGTKGVPGTPRDGAPVEITGLLKSTLRWLGVLSKAGKFPFQGVRAESEFLTVWSIHADVSKYVIPVDGKSRLVTYNEWEALVQDAFERCYYIPLGTCDHSCGVSQS